jgi:hypothetical protein
MNALRTLFLFSAAVLGAVALTAASKPDFSGTWKLNMDKSDLGGAPLSGLSVLIEHKDPEFKYTAKGTFDGQDFEESESFSTDGKPRQDSRGNTITGHWDGAVMVTEVNAPDGSLVYKARMSMSDDGKTSIRDHTPGNDLEPKRHEVYEKQ